MKGSNTTLFKARLGVPITVTNIDQPIRRMAKNFFGTLNIDQPIRRLSVKSSVLCYKDVTMLYQFLISGHQSMT